MKKFNLPLLLLGGGGYTIRNVARCWAYETAIALDVEISNELPYNDYFEYYSNDFKLHIIPSNMTNLNTPDYLQKMQSTIFEHLRHLPYAPSVQMQPIKDEITDETMSKSSYKCFSILENCVEGDNEFYEEHSIKPNRNERSHNLSAEDLSPETKRIRISSQSPKSPKSPKSFLGSKFSKSPKYSRSTSDS
ncbi:unnamed protein product [Brugia pahangi]|uniref:Histone deacetylase n=1 Tax=Brugia pahangi TaxID=6280 RepID=A0A0N4TBF4_BRUPA|nr:unnamed protein product [Brugia pahangi]